MRRLCTIVMLTAGLVVGAPAVTQAATVRIADAADDVRQATFTEEGEVTDTPAPTASPDIVSTTITHGHRRITVRMAFDDLVAPTDDQLVGVGFELTGNKRRQTRSVSAFDTADGTFDDVSRLNGRTTCGPRKVRSSFDYDAETVTVSFRRFCAGSPGRIKIAGGAVAVDGFTEETGTFTYDDALESEGSVDTFGTTRSRWVKRG